MFEEVLSISSPETAQGLRIGAANASTPTDEQLVQSVLDGDDDAFTEIFERYKRPVTRVISRMFTERSVIEELVQQSFTKSFFSLAKYRGGEERSFAAWIVRISVNVCYDEFRRRGRRAESLFSEISDAESEYVEQVVDRHSPSVENSLVAAQLIEKMLSGLEARDRVAFSLVYSSDHSLEEAAELLGISASNLKSRLFRCRDQIRKRFGHLI